VKIPGHCIVRTNSAIEVTLSCVSPSILSLAGMDKMGELVHVRTNTSILDFFELTILPEISSLSKCVEGYKSDGGVMAGGMHAPVSLLTS
jgi:hypothetical protein